VLALPQLSFLLTFGLQPDPVVIRDR
jgi:hypothetical protein